MKIVISPRPYPKRRFSVDARRYKNHLQGKCNLARRDWYSEDVLSGKIEVRTVWEDERMLAFHHPQPTAPIHVLIIPKAHVPGLLDPAALDGQGEVAAPGIDP
jgi:hypothetical protein